MQRQWEYDRFGRPMLIVPEKLHAHIKYMYIFKINYIDQYFVYFPIYQRKKVLFRLLFFMSSLILYSDILVKKYVDMSLSKTVASIWWPRITQIVTLGEWENKDLTKPGLSGDHIA